MIELRSITSYIKSMVDTISIATGMEVIVTDADCRVLGDSDSNGKNMEYKDCREDLEVLSDTSIVRKSILAGKGIYLPDVKRENPACATCVNKKVCKISSIIAYPLFDEETIIGGIGLYAVNEQSREFLNCQKDTFDSFVSNISDLIISKARERENSRAFQNLSERLRLLIESMDESIIGFDEENNISEVNSRFCKEFKIPLKERQNMEYVFRKINSEALNSFVEECFQNRNPGKKVINCRKDDYVVSYKPVLSGGKFCGGLMYFKRSSDIYKDIRHIKDSSYYEITFDDILGHSDVMTVLKRQAMHFAKGPSTILLQGASGTGKEMFARAIHNESMVSKGPFVAINCAAIPDNLIESELFGHKEGAFTGSMKGGKIGKFEMADKGTLFLDEIGEMPLHLQSKLLRAIQEKRIQPVGSNAYIPVDIRIIAATNQNLEKMIDEGSFREDLYYRLSVIPLSIPALEERKEDIPELLQYFLEKYNSMLNKAIMGFEPEAVDILCAYDWPGNIRELQNVVEYAANDCLADYIGSENLPRKNRLGPMIENDLEIKTMEEIEEMYIREALKQYGKTSAGKTKAAKALGIARSTFYRKLSKLGIE